MRTESTVYKLIKKEYLRVSAELERYEAEIKNLPHGSIRIMSGRYLYLCYRDKNGKYISEYQGTIDEEKAQTIRRDVNKRNLYRDLLKELRKERDELEGYMKAGERFYKKHSKDKEAKVELEYDDHE